VQQEALIDAQAPVTTDEIEPQPVVEAAPVPKTPEVSVVNNVETTLIADKVTTTLWSLQLASLADKSAANALTKKVHFFKSNPFVMVDQGGFASRFGTETQFVGANPSRAAQIKYFLPKRHTFGKMSMEIQDMDGNKVSTISPGKSKGINIVN